MEPKRRKIIISGGGTGGHIFPALSIADAIRNIHPDTDILFVGAEGKMEMERVPAAGYPIEGLPVAGLQRSLSLSNLALPFKLWKSLRKARQIIRKFRPDVVVGVGGYASAPTLWSASRMGIPCLIQEQNSYAGLTNKLLGKRAKKICVAYDRMERFFPQEKILLTGNPIRSNIHPATPEQRSQARAYFSLSEDRPVLLVVGGSLGARTLNQALCQWVTQMDPATPYQILWQSGKYYRPEMEQFFASLPGWDPSSTLHPESGKEYELRSFGNVRNSDFIKRMDLALAVADCVVSRAGAGTISELCAAAKASVFVPSPAVTEDHQTHNAQALVRHQAAEMVRDDQALEQLRPRCEALLQDPGQRELYARNILQLAKPTAATDIAQEVLQLIPKQ